MHLVKIKNKLKIGCFTNKVEKNSRYFVGIFNKTIIPLALVGYEMIIANWALTLLMGIIISHPMPTRAIIVHYNKNIMS